MATVALWGAAIAGFGFARTLWLALLLLVGAGVPRLGNFEAGAVASLTSPAVSAISGGLGTMAGALLIRLAFPAVARYDPRAKPAPAGDDAPESTAIAT